MIESVRTAFKAALACTDPKERHARLQQVHAKIYELLEAELEPSDIPQATQLVLEVCIVLTRAAS